MTRSEVLAGLKTGRTLIVDNKTNEFLPWLLKLEADGLVESEFVEYDEQSSAIKFRMKSNLSKGGSTKENTDVN